MGTDPCINFYSPEWKRPNPHASHAHVCQPPSECTLHVHVCQQILDCTLHVHVCQQILDCTLHAHVCQPTSECTLTTDPLRHCSDRSDSDRLPNRGEPHGGRPNRTKSDRAASGHERPCRQTTEGDIRQPRRPAEPGPVSVGRRTDL